MATKEIQRQHLADLIELARVYRGWSRRQLAKALGRDPSKLIPESGIPKLDLVLELSSVLDWPIEDVIRGISGFESDDEDQRPVSGTYEELNDASYKAYLDGQYPEMIRLARAAFANAKDGNERARACNREAGGWDGLGRYREAMAALRRGLEDRSAPEDMQLLLRANLANEYYNLWQLYEAKGIATEIIDQLKGKEPSLITSRTARGIAHYVKGHCYRRLLHPKQDGADAVANTASDHLLQAQQYLNQIAEDESNSSYSGTANTCRGGVLEVSAFTGQDDAEAVLTQFVSGLEKLGDRDNWPVGDWLESYGWWCIFGCNVALRHIQEDAALQRHMAVFTNMADQIAGRLGNWSMRERVFTMEFARRERLSDWSGIDTEWSIDDDDVRLIAGTMGRFPTFHSTGWRILRTAKIIRRN